MKSVFKSIKKKFSSKDKEKDPSAAEKKSDGDKESRSSSKPGKEHRDKSPTDGKDKERSGKDRPRRKSKDRDATTGSPNGSGAASFSDMQNEFTMQDLLKPIPNIQSAPPSDRAALFVKKLRLCSVIFEWEPEKKERAADDEPGMVRKSVDTTKHKPENAEEVRAKEVKREMLLELVEHVGKTRNFITEPILIEMLKMVSTNLFRALPSQN